MARWHWLQWRPCIFLIVISSIVNLIEHARLYFRSTFGKKNHLNFLPNHLISKKNLNSKCQQPHQTYNIFLSSLNSIVNRIEDARLHFQSTFRN